MSICQGFKNMKSLMPASYYFFIVAITFFKKGKGFMIYLSTISWIPFSATKSCSGFT